MTTFVNLGPGIHTVPVFVWAGGQIVSGTEVVFEVTEWGGILMEELVVPYPVDHVVFELPDQCYMIDVGRSREVRPGDTMTLKVESGSGGNVSFEKCDHTQVQPVEETGNLFLGDEKIWEKDRSNYE